MQAATLVSTLLDDMRSFLMQIGVVDVTKLHLVHVPRTATSLNALEVIEPSLPAAAADLANRADRLLVSTGSLITAHTAAGSGTSGGGTSGGGLQPPRAGSRTPALGRPWIS